MLPINATIKVKVEKGHLLTLGERMYVESIELVRELVNNAYDADAMLVYVTITPETVVIEDNGSGMNEKGLTQFFTVGSEEKRTHSVSPKFGRKRIGQFGIGKFAALAAADQFVVESRKGDFIYSVTFDREEWQKNENWELPITKEPATPLHHEGTKVTLLKLKKQFNVSEVERYLKEAVPIRVKKFTVYLNGKRITARYIAGRRFPLSVKTVYGLIDGEIVLALRADLVDKPGVECRVKQVLIKRESFNSETSHSYGLNRITGEVNADFLPVTSGRNDFLRDSAEYKLFYQIMHSQLEKILKELKKEADVKNLKRIKEELKNVLGRIREALELNPELTPSGRAVAKRSIRKDEAGGSALVRSVAAQKKISESTQEKNGPEKEKKAVMPKPEVIRRIKLKKLGVSVALVSLGSSGPEVVAQGNLIYLNSDHPLYLKLYRRKEQFELHLLRLITQEIVLMKKARLNAVDAFNWQSQLLTSALCGGHKKV